jgi:hypothetical protein
MIRIYIGTAEKYRPIEGEIEYAIRSNASEDLDITFMRAGWRGLAPTGCTGFSMYRYAIPELTGWHGFAIYLDVDMLVVGDIAELWEYRFPGRWSVLKDGSQEVMVIDCRTNVVPTVPFLNRMHKSQIAIPERRVIPPEWNCEDCAPPGAKLIHFTDLSRQPWFTPDRTGPEVDRLTSNREAYATYLSR